MTPSPWPSPLKGEGNFQHNSVIFLFLLIIRALALLNFRHFKLHISNFLFLFKLYFPPPIRVYSCSFVANSPFFPIPSPFIRLWRDLASNGWRVANLLLFSSLKIWYFYKLIQGDKCLRTRRLLFEDGWFFLISWSSSSHLLSVIISSIDGIRFFPF